MSSARSGFPFFSLRGQHGATRRELLTGMGATGVAILAGCSANARTPSGPHFRIGTLHPAVTLDPITAKYLGSRQATGLLFDGLYGYDNGTTIGPRIAANEPTVEDDQTVRVQIDEAAQFHNGQLITAEDVKYSFEAPLTEDTANAGMVDIIESIEVINDKTVRFRLKHPYPAFDHTLTRAIVPKEAREANPTKFETEPIGSGPFQIRKFTEEKKTQVVRWDGYWREPQPAIATVTLVHVESPITQMMSLRTNRNDAITPVSPHLIGRIPDVTDASIQRAPGHRVLYLGFNLNDGPTTDSRVREAISYCIDMDEVVKKFISPIGSRIYSPVPARVADEWEFPRDEWAEIPNRLNPKRAKELFELAGVGSGQFKILTSKDPMWKEIAEALAGGLRDAGHGALVVSKPWKKFVELSMSGAKQEYSLFIGEITGTSDPDSYLYPAFHENLIGQSNGTFYNEEPVMKRLMSARQTHDREERRRLYEEAVTRLLEDRVCLPIAALENSFAVGERVHNFHVHPIAHENPRLIGENHTVTVNT